jgi:hypothetical protein
VGRETAIFPAFLLARPQAPSQCYHKPRFPDRRFRCQLVQTDGGSRVCSTQYLHRAGQREEGRATSSGPETPSWRASEAIAQRRCGWLWSMRRSVREEWERPLRQQMLR